MEKFIASINSAKQTLERRWKQLSSGQKRRIVQYAFACYVVLTLGVLVQVVYGLGSSADSMDVQHIENPILKIQQVKDAKNQSKTMECNGK